MWKLVVVGADGSATSRRAVETAAKFAATSGAKLHVVTAYSHSSEDDARALLQSLAAEARALGVEPTVHAEKGDAADVIINTARHVSADLVIVGNRGMKGVRRTLGSVPNSVAHGVNCSVLIVDTTE